VMSRMVKFSLIAKSARKVRIARIGTARVERGGRHETHCAMTAPVHVKSHDCHRFSNFFNFN
jgi:hypothetical protein